MKLTSIKDFIKKIIVWFSESGRFLHLILGILIYIIIFFVSFMFMGYFESAYTGAVTLSGVAFAMEYKDKAWGGKWDWIDIACTVVIPYIITLMILLFK